MMIYWRENPCRDLPAPNTACFFRIAAEGYGKKAWKITIGWLNRQIDGDWWVVVDPAGFLDHVDRDNPMLCILSLDDPVLLAWGPISPPEYPSEWDSDDDDFADWGLALSHG